MTIRRAYADIDGRQIHYRHAGDPDAPVFVLLHQSPSSSVMYEAMMAELADNWFVVAPDLPGFGSSDALDDVATVEAWALVVAQLLGTLEVSRCVIFGHHTGAAVAAQIAADAKIACPALILSGPTLLNDTQKAALPAQATAFPLQESGGHLLGMWERIGNKEPQAPLALRQRETLLGLALGDRYPEAYDAVIAHDFESLLPRLRMPVLLMAGARDPLQSCVAPTLERLHDGRAIDLGDTGSWCCDLASREICVAIRGFLRDIERPGAATA